MEYYEKGDVVEITDNIPLNFSETCLHMKVGYGSKIKNLIGYALKKFKVSLEIYYMYYILCTMYL